MTECAVNGGVVLLAKISENVRLLQIAARNISENSGLDALLDRGVTYPVLSPFFYVRLMRRRLKQCG